MKLLKSFAVGSAVLACASFAQAAQEVVVRLTGATAFRQSVHAALVDSLNNCRVGYEGTSLGSATKATFKGTIKSEPRFGTAQGKTALFQVSWNGSAAGIQAVAQTHKDGVAATVPLSFLTEATASGESNVVVAISGSATPVYGEVANVDGKIGNPGATATESQLADVSFSDVGQASTVFAAGDIGVEEGSGKIADGNVTDVGPSILTIAPLSEKSLGVVAFSWIKVSASANTTANSRIAAINNITNWQASAVLSAGKIPLSLLTGVSTDRTTPVYVTGRNADSGTRVTAFAECGFGAGSTPIQYQFVTTGSSITDINVFPEDVVQGIYFNFGVSGEASGGTLVKALSKKITSTVLVNGETPAVAPLAIGYASVADVKSNSATSLYIPYNGVLYTDAALLDGKYSFWGNEVMGYKSTYSGLGKDYADGLADKIVNETAQISGAKFSDMQANRTAEGLPIFTNLSL